MRVSDDFCRALPTRLGDKETDVLKPVKKDSDVNNLKSKSQRGKNIR